MKYLQKCKKIKKRSVNSNRIDDLLNYDKNVFLVTNEPRVREAVFASSACSTLQIKFIVRYFPRHTGHKHVITCFTRANISPRALYHALATLGT